MVSTIAGIAQSTIAIEDVQATPTTAIAGVRAFRAGTWTDGWGEQRTWTLAEMQEAVENYNASASAGIRRAPVLLNHGSDPGDRGWVSPTARLEGDTIILDLEQVDLAFAADLKAGRWTYRSIGFWSPSNPYNPTPGKWNIAELSFTPLPAVDGLGTVFSVKDWISNNAPKFSTKAKADKTASLKISFARSPMFSAKGANPENPKFQYWGMGMEAIATMLQGQRDRMLAESGDVATTNEAYPDWAIASIREMASQSFMTADDMELLLSEISGLYEMIGRLEDRIIEGQMKELEQTNARGFAMATDKTTPDVTATDHSAQFAAIAEENTDLKAKNTELESKLQTLSTVVEQLQEQAAEATRKAEEVEVKGDVAAIARELGMDQDSPEFGTFVSKHTVFALAQSKDVVEGHSFSVGDKKVSARDFYLDELRDRKPAPRKFSADRIDIEVSQPAADITARRKNRALPGLAK